MKRVISFNIVIVFLMALLLLSLAVSTQRVGAQAQDCEIPESGPWPACATAGEGAAASGDTASCPIPESGPWPPCASSNAGGAAASAGASNNSGASCPIPETGPWPPCATANAAGSGGGAAAPAPAAPADSAARAANPGARTYSLPQVRAMMTAVMNESFTGNANCGGNQCFTNETTVTIENDTIRMVGFTMPSGSAADVKIDLLMRVSAENGEAVVTVIRLTRNRVVASTPEQLADAGARASAILDGRLETELNASEFTAISAANNSLMVSYR